MLEREKREEREREREKKGLRRRKEEKKNSKKNPLLANLITPIYFFFCSLPSFHNPTITHTLSPLHTHLVEQGEGLLELGNLLLGQLVSHLIKGEGSGKKVGGRKNAPNKHEKVFSALFWCRRRVFFWPFFFRLHQTSFMSSKMADIAPKRAPCW